MATDDHSEIGHSEEYGDEGIRSNDAPIPKWLIANYIFWPIFGFVWFFYFWNGSYGWLDRGYWQQLQRAANTTIPFENVTDTKAASATSAIKEQGF